MSCLLAVTVKLSMSIFLQDIVIEFISLISFLSKKEHYETNNFQAKLEFETNIFSWNKSVMHHDFSIMAKEKGPNVYGVFFQAFLVKYFPFKLCFLSKCVIFFKFIVSFYKLIICLFIL